MTVNVSKPAINVREKLAELDKPTGIAGEAMLRAETPQEQFNLIGAGRRNLIINGAMQVSQRGTSFTNPNAVYTLDRFVARAGTSGALTVSQQSMDYGQTDVPNIQNFVRCDQTTARTGAHSFFWQRVEDVTRFDNTDVTLSFYAKCSVNKQIEITTYQDFGDSGSSDAVVDNTNFDIETSWKRFEVTMHCPSISGKTVNAGSYLLVEFRDETLGTFTLDITGIQLEYGKVATPFEHRSYGEELALCQRYFQKSTEQSIFPANGADTTSFAGSMGNTLNLPPVAIWSHPTHVYLPVEMRAAPTMTRYGNSQGYWGYLSIGTAGPSGLSSFNFHQNVYIGGTPKTVYVNNQVSTNPMWGAKGMWTADAEL
jgi:hypothetical protein